MMVPVLHDASSIADETSTEVSAVSARVDSEDEVELIHHFVPLLCEIYRTI